MVNINPDCISLGCNECCGFVPIDNRDFVTKGLRNYFADKENTQVCKMNMIDKRGKKRVAVIATRIIADEQKCAFLNDKGLCNIYNDRPSVCKGFGGEKSKTEHCLVCPKINPEHDNTETFEHTQKLLQQHGINLTQIKHPKVKCNGCDVIQELNCLNRKRFIELDEEIELTTNSEHVVVDFYLCQKCFDQQVEIFEALGTFFTSKFMEKFKQGKKTISEFLQVVCVETSEHWQDVANGLQEKVTMIIEDKI